MMVSDDMRGELDGRSVLFLLGMGIGGALIALVYLMRQWDRLPLALPTGPGSVSPPGGVQLKVAEQAESMPLTIQVIPTPLISGEAATVRAMTIPEATCIIDAHYSTGRPPSSLDTRPQKADSAGECEWTWNVRTQGNYVIVEVQAWSEGREIERVEQRIEIMQQA